MVNDMLQELYKALKSRDELKNITIKSFERPETLDAKSPSIVIIPVNSPIQAGLGSNKSLRKRFTYQVNVEARDRLQAKGLAMIVEKVLWEKGFYQVPGGLEDYLSEIKRYVDVRTYRGYSPLYQNY